MKTLTLVEAQTLAALVQSRAQLSPPSVESDAARMAVIDFNIDTVLGLNEQVEVEVEEVEVEPFPFTVYPGEAKKDEPLFDHEPGTGYEFFMPKAQPMTPVQAKVAHPVPGHIGTSPRVYPTRIKIPRADFPVPTGPGTPIPAYEPMLPCTPSTMPAPMPVVAQVAPIVTQTALTQAPAPSFPEVKMPPGILPGQGMYAQMMAMQQAYGMKMAPTGPAPYATPFNR